MIDTDETKRRVAAVCGPLVTLYDRVEPETGKRPELSRIKLGHYGQAKQYANEYEERQRKGKNHG
jgi:hypothetical protein